MERYDLAAALLHQFAANERLNLLADEAVGAARIAPEFLDALRRPDALPHDDDEVQRLCHAAAGECERRILAVNPYLEIDSVSREELTAIYRRSLTILGEGGDPAEVIAAVHMPALKQWITDRYPPALREQLSEVRTPGHLLGRVVYTEHRPEMQFAVLRLPLKEIRGSVLDVGCGPSMALVVELRRRGIEADGIDRSLGSSWFDFVFSRRRYATIISHLAFSSHALHHHEARSDHAPAYRMLYTEILDSLIPGGEFRYVPSLPHLEEQLSAGSFSVERWVVANGVQATCVTRRQTQ